ncbi:MAG: aldehyde dehydrogenase family protein, partial [Sneathiellales bacterium]|nr:aldehyde dehydrogenase family protein [Sneathiellales bacterium]
MSNEINNPLNLKDPDLFRQQGLIGGTWCNAESGATLDVTNPATGEVMGTIPKMGALETKRAIDAAKAAMPEWA